MARERPPVALAGPDYDADLRVLVAAIHARPLTDWAWILVGECEWAERAAQALHGAGAPVVSWQTPPYRYTDIHGWVCDRLVGTFDPFDQMDVDGEDRLTALGGRLAGYLEVESCDPHDGMWRPLPWHSLPDRPRGKMSQEMEDALLGRPAYWRHLTPAARARNGPDEREVDAAVRVHEAAQAGDIARYRCELAEAAAVSRRVDVEAAAIGAAARAAFGPRSLHERRVTAAPPEEARPRPLGRGRVTRFGNAYELPASAGEVPLSANQIAADLAEATDGWPRRVGGDLFVRDGFQLLWLDEVPALYAWIGRQFGGPGRTFLDENNVLWPVRPGLVPKGEFFSHLQQAAEAYEAVESFPHEPALAGHYYLHPALCGGDGAALDEYLGFFSPATRHDRALMRAALMTLIWGGPPGQRPAFTVTSDAEVTRDDQKGRGAGKTTFVKKTAELLGGYIDVRPTHTAEAITKRLLSPEARGRRIVLIDNIQSARFAWDDLEAIITANVISGHQMYAGEGRRPNTLTWFLTMNGASMSKDMSQRTVTIMVTRPAVYAGDWEARVSAFIEARRWHVIGDLCAALRVPPVKLRAYTRWGVWDREILARQSNPDAVQDLIGERRGAADGDEEEGDLVREYIVDQLRRRRHDPDRAKVFIPAATLAPWVNDATGERRPTNRASAYLRGLPIPELSKSNRAEKRGWLWQGKDCDPKLPAVPLNDLPTAVRFAPEVEDLLRFEE